MDSLVAVIALGAVVAGFVQDLSGFGLRIVATAFWAWTVDPKLAAALAVFGSHAGQWLVVFTVRRRFDAPRLLPFIAGGVVGVPVGVARLPMLDANLFKAILGVLLVTWGPAMSMAKQLPRIGAGGPLADGAIGVVGGVTGGIGGIGGSIPTLWCKLQGMDKDAQRAVAWGLTQAARLGGNPKRVFVMGHSAGAYNAAMLALDPRWLAATGHTPAELASWIGLAGPYDFFPTDNLDAQPVFFHPNYPAACTADRVRLGERAAQLPRRAGPRRAGQPDAQHAEPGRRVESGRRAGHAEDV